MKRLLSNLVLISFGIALIGFSLKSIGPIFYQGHTDVCENKTPVETHETASLSCSERPKPLLQIVKICQGLISFSTIDGNGDETISKAPKTVIFLKVPGGVPDIITAKIFNLRVLDVPVGQVASLGISDVNESAVLDHGIHAEHGTLEGLRLSDRRREQNRYETLLQDAAEACIGSPDEPDFDARSSEFMEEIEKNATAYVSFDVTIQNPEARVTVYYDMNGRIYSMDIPMELMPI